jgi:hypothetical protein
MSASQPSGQTLAITFTISSTTFPSGYTIALVGSPVVSGQITGQAFSITPPSTGWATSGSYNIVYTATNSAGSANGTITFNLAQIAEGSTASYNASTTALLTETMPTNNPAGEATGPMSAGSEAPVYGTLTISDAATLQYQYQATSAPDTDQFTLNINPEMYSFSTPVGIASATQTQISTITTTNYTPATAANASKDLVLGVSYPLSLSTYATGSSLTYDFGSSSSDLDITGENTSTGAFTVAFVTGTKAGATGTLDWSCSNPQSSSSQATWTFTAKNPPT